MSFDRKATTDSLPTVTHAGGMREQQAAQVAKRFNMP